MPRLTAHVPAATPRDVQRGSAQASGQKGAAKSRSEIAPLDRHLDQEAAPPSSNRASPTFDAPEVFGREAVANIARALPLVERAYANIRFRFCVRSF